MLRRVDRAAVELLALFHARQPAAFAVFVSRVVAVFLIELQEAVEHDRGAGRMQADLAGRIGNIDRHLVEHRRRHLARYGPFPDQLVETALVVVDVPRDIAGLAHHVGWADRLVGFLRIFRRAAVDARLRRHVPAAELAADQLARAGDRLGGDGDAVGPHIGDQPDRIAAEVDALVEPLGDLHRPARAETELARGFLL